MNDTVQLLIIVMLLGIMAELYILTRPKKQLTQAGSAVLIDTSALMDGRVVDIAKTGFLLGQIIVPRSVLAEMQLLADGSDHAKRERARFGMDKMKELKDILGNRFTLLVDEGRIPEGVDNRLLRLAHEHDASILTLDYNLNKVAQVEGVEVLNINELAKSLRMAHLPGDVMDLELTQKGQDTHQAVGYLRDGTMVVVEQAKKFINQTKTVEIIRSLQTDAGKMMFARLVSSEPHETMARPLIPQKQPSRGRRPNTVNQRTPRQGSSPEKMAEPTRRSDNSQPSKRQNSSKSFRPSSAQREANLIELVNKQ